jgi:hypothetical protein
MRIVFPCLHRAELLKAKLLLKWQRRIYAVMRLLFFGSVSFPVPNARVILRE